MLSKQDAYFRMKSHVIKISIVYALRERNKIGTRPGYMVL